MIVRVSFLRNILTGPDLGLDLGLDFGLDLGLDIVGLLGASSFGWWMSRTG